MKKTLTLIALLGAMLPVSYTAQGGETVWVDGITPDDPSTYYAFTKGGSYDSPMCWAISAASVLAWWEDNVEASGALIMPSGIPRGDEMWPAVRELFLSRGGQTGRAFQFWLSGDTQYSNDSQWLTEEGFAFKETGGYFPRLAGTHFDFSVTKPRPDGCMTYTLDLRGYSTDTTYEASSKVLVQLLKEGYGGALNTGSHAMALYGVETDDDGNVIKVWYDDNNKYSDNATEKGQMPNSAAVYRGENRIKEGETVDRYSTAASIGYDYAISGVSLIRTKGLQFTDYDVRVGSNFEGEDEFLFSHYCNLIVDGADNYELKYDLRDAGAEGSPVDPTLTTYAEDGQTVLKRETVSTGNLRLMDGTVSLVDSVGDTAQFDKGGSVEGRLSFEDSAKSGANAARKLSVQRDGAQVGELAITATEGSNTIEVTDDNTLSIGKLTGKGDLAKTGTGSAVVTDALELEGTVHVQGGCFLLGESATFSDKVTLAVANGAHMESVADKPVTLSITSGIHTNDGEMKLTTTLTGGTLKGSGSFGTVTVDGGKLVVGNSPGHQDYEGALTLNSGSMVFSVAGVNEAASLTSSGWESGTYSNVDMHGNNFTADGGEIVIALSREAADCLTMGGGEYALTLVSGMGNELSREQLDSLAGRTTFQLTDAADAAAVTAPAFAYKMSGNALVLTAGSSDNGNVPEPTSGTLSLLALAGLMTRRRRR